MIIFQFHVSGKEKTSHKGLKISEMEDWILFLSHGFMGIMLVLN